MKQDLRVIKSRQAIESAFINLVELKGFQNITIKEIADKAMVNRNTIYLNYGTKEDILESILSSSIEKYFGDINKDTFKNIGLSRKKIEGLFQSLFKVVDENIELYRIILTDSASTGYLQTALYRIQKGVDSIIKPSSRNKIRSSFMISGMWGVVNNYIVYAIGTTEENIKILTDLTLSNLRHLSYSK